MTQSAHTPLGTAASRNGFDSGFRVGDNWIRAPHLSQFVVGVLCCFICHFLPVVTPDSVSAVPPPPAPCRTRRTLRGFAGHVPKASRLPSCWPAPGCRP